MKLFFRKCYIEGREMLSFKQKILLNFIYINPPITDSNTCSMWIFLYFLVSVCKCASVFLCGQISDKNNFRVHLKSDPEDFLYTEHFLWFIQI